MRRVEPENAKALWFDSNFECGNAERVIAFSDTEYEIVVGADTNAPQRSQWFYFRVENARKGVHARFTVRNQSKSPHFYCEGGMRPVVFSEHLGMNSDEVDECTVTKMGAETVAAGRPISLLETGKERTPSTEQTTQCQYYAISFSYTFKHDGDRVYFSFCQPYAFTRLKRLYDQIETKLLEHAVGATSSNIDSMPQVQIETNDFCYRRGQIATSAGGLPIDAMTIAGSAAALDSGECVVITARAHAAETPGSFKAEGMLRFILSRDPAATAMRRHFAFLIVPMLNPDGVVLGNSRYSMEGCDLNRCWGSPSERQHPAVYALKELLRRRVSAGHRVAVYCDLHGHSKLYGSFIYACHKAANSSICSWTRSRQLPRILARRCPFFDYRQCRFRVEGEKTGTGRVVLWREFGVANSFTLETSVYAYSTPQGVGLGKGSRTPELEAGKHGNEEDGEETSNRERRAQRNVLAIKQFELVPPTNTGSRAESCMAVTKYQTFDAGSAMWKRPGRLRAGWGRSNFAEIRLELDPSVACPKTRPAPTRNYLVPSCEPTSTPAASSNKSPLHKEKRLPVVHLLSIDPEVVERRFQPMQTQISTTHDWKAAKPHADTKTNWRNYGKAKGIDVATRAAELQRAGSDVSASNDKSKAQRKKQLGILFNPIAQPKSLKYSLLHSAFSGKQRELLSRMPPRVRPGATISLGRSHSGAKANRSFGQTTYCNRSRTHAGMECGKQKSVLQIDFARTLDRKGEWLEGVLCNREVERIVLCRSRRVVDGPGYCQPEVAQRVTEADIGSLFAGGRSKSKG